MPAIEKLGKYEIRREIGRGAMGVVYEGYDPMIKRAVAIKTIRADQLAREEADDILARFRREAQAAGRLNHPNIVAIYDFDEDDGTSFIAMEYVEGRDLRDYFAANERFASAEAFRIMGDILAALEYSHAHGVVHRDIKPANVFMQARRRGEGRRLRHRAHRIVEPDAGGRGDGHARLHVARAGPRAAGRRPLRPLLRRA